MGRAGKFAAHVLTAFLAALAACFLVEGRIVDWRAALHAAVIFAALAAAVETVVGLERAPWRFVTVGDVFRLARSGAFVAVLLVAVMVMTRLPLPGGVRAAVLTIMLYPGGVAAIRILRRAVHEGHLWETLTGAASEKLAQRAPLLIVGGAAEAEIFLRNPGAQLRNTYSPVGVISPVAKEIGDELRGVCVLGSTQDFDGVVARLRESGLAPAAVLFLSPPGALPEFGAERIGRLKAEGVRLLRRPAMVEIGRGPSVSGLREISMEELLARPPVQLDMAVACGLVAGKRVLVTGAGGSIGSEICRQVAACGPARLVLLDASERSLFEIGCEIRDSHPDLAMRELMCDVRDRVSLNIEFMNERPDIVFHAAALKHVPLVEQHPCEGVQTNVFGTRNVVEAARRCGAAHLAMISTDKAVDPSSVMGATKRLAETIVRTAADENFCVSVVRFGNVLGSAGSVATVFQNQIERGGPVTVTDLAVERYFMTIPEAVRLVLQAAALSCTGGGVSGVLTLEMGEPVRIVDLARRMIELNGLVPDQDIEIRVMGLRDGEKMSEALTDAGEAAQPLAPGILQAVSQQPLEPLADTELAALDALVRQGDSAGVKTAVFRLVDQVRRGRAARLRAAEG